MKYFILLVLIALCGVSVVCPLFPFRPNMPHLNTHTLLSYILFPTVHSSIIRTLSPDLFFTDDICRLEVSENDLKKNPYTHTQIQS